MYSKNAIEGDGKADITYRFMHEEWNEGIEYYSTHNKTITYYPKYNGLYQVYASIDDGQSTTTIHLGSTMFVGGTGCSTCGELN